MTRGFKRLLKGFVLAGAWFLALLWPLTGISPEGLSFARTFGIWGWSIAVLGVALGVFALVRAFRERESVRKAFAPVRETVRSAKTKLISLPNWLRLGALLVLLCLFPQFTGRYEQDVAIQVLVYVCLGLGLNVVVGLAGLLDLGYIAFYGVGAYTYAILSVHYQLSFWFALPLAAAFAALAGCIIGYPTLRMRGDYLAIVTLGFGEIVRLVLNNWMALTNGPNGILGIEPPGLVYPTFAQGLSFEHLWMKKLSLLYYVILVIAVITVVAVRNLNYSRIGRAWEAIREDETAAQLMGVNTFLLKLLAYAMGAVFGGMAGAFFAARMRFVSPESFTFIESAMVLAMVVLGGMASIPGIILGALALIVLPEVFRQFELYRMLAFGGAMTIMMLLRPEGLIPARRFGARSEEREPA